ncbi:unnamed protein product [Clonostachys solani]|uniref:Uncharacterized protein n=1 Tax=Clonostachys solani TaxID=160281 RepID=A0A9N9ZIG9_9HYPO|nr:unnamed protein product [Clonostachys solani]
MELRESSSFDRKPKFSDSDSERETSSHPVQERGSAAPPVQQGRLQGQDEPFWLSPAARNNNGLRRNTRLSQRQDTNFSQLTTDRETGDSSESANSVRNEGPPPGYVRRRVDYDSDTDEGVPQLAQDADQGAPGADPNGEDHLGLPNGGELPGLQRAILLETKKRQDIVAEYDVRDAVRPHQARVSVGALDVSLKGKGLTDSFRVAAAEENRESLAARYIRVWIAKTKFFAVVHDVRQNLTPPDPVPVNWDGFQNTIQILREQSSIAPLLLYHYKVSSRWARYETSAWWLAIDLYTSLYINMWNKTHNELADEVEKYSMIHQADLTQKVIDLLLKKVDDSLSLLFNITAVNESRSVNRLTYLAFIYVPLSFATSVWGMSQFKIAVEWVAVLALPLLILTVFLVVISHILARKLDDRKMDQIKARRHNPA